MKQAIFKFFELPLSIHCGLRRHVISQPNIKPYNTAVPLNPSLPVAVASQFMIR
jgi:hypothetical protein